MFFSLSEFVIVRTAGQIRKNTNHHPLRSPRAPTWSYGPLKNSGPTLAALLTHTHKKQKTKKTLRTSTPLLIGPFFSLGNFYCRAAMSLPPFFWFIDVRSRNTTLTFSSFYPNASVSCCFLRARFVKLLPCRARGRATLVASFGDAFVQFSFSFSAAAARLSRFL